MSINEMVITKENTEINKILIKLEQCNYLKDFLSSIGCVIYGREPLEEIERHYGVLKNMPLPLSVVCEYIVKSGSTDRGFLRMPLYNQKNLAVFNHHFARLLTLLGIKYYIQYTEFEQSHSNPTAEQHHNKVIYGQRYFSKKKKRIAIHTEMFNKLNIEYTEEIKTLLHFHNPGKVDTLEYVSLVEAKVHDDFGPNNYGTIINEMIVLDLHFTEE